MATAKKLKPQKINPPKPKRKAQAISASKPVVKNKVSTPKKKAKKKAKKKVKTVAVTVVKICNKCSRQKPAKKSSPQEHECFCGRPMFNGRKVEDVVTKLESVFAVGGTDEEACFYADISRTSLFRYEEKFPEFRNRKELLKTKLILVARTNLSDVMGEKNADDKPTDRALQTSMRYLERKKRDEFGDKENDTPPPVNELPEYRKQQIAETMQAWSEPADDEEDELDSDYEIS